MLNSFIIIICLRKYLADEIKENLKKLKKY